MKNVYFWPKSKGEKWPGNNIFEIPPCPKPFGPTDLPRKWEDFYPKLQIQ